jgi:hypothetical protein
VFGTTRLNSDYKRYSVRDIAEQHVQEDLGFIPTMEQWFKGMPIEPWMMGRAGAKVTKSFIPMEDGPKDDFMEQLYAMGNTDGPRSTPIPEEGVVVNTEFVNDQNVFIDGQFRGPSISVTEVDDGTIRPVIPPKPKGLYFD